MFQKLFDATGDISIKEKYSLKWKKKNLYENIYKFKILRFLGYFIF